MVTRSEVYKIGRLGKPHGVQGELSFAFTDDIFDRVEADYVFLDRDGLLVPFFIAGYRFQSDSLALITFDGIDTQEQARELTGSDVFFPKALSDSDSETITWDEIVGFRLLNAASGEVVGTIQSVDDSTQNVLFNVVDAQGHSVLLPASEPLIAHVDTVAKTVEMHLPEGILDL